MNMSRSDQVIKSNEQIISDIANGKPISTEAVIASMLLQISETLAIIADNTTPDKAIEEGEQE